VADPAPWIDPEYVAMGAMLRERGLNSLSPVNSPLADCRSMLGRIGAFLNEGSIALKQERDVAVPGPHGEIPCRLYLPDGIERPPLLVYAHGGSFAIGTLSAWNGMLRDLVRQSGVAVLSVDYRLAPEHRFPVAGDEMLAAIRFAAHEGTALGTDSSRLAVGGDSAGANLALGAALSLRDAGASPLSFLLLIYGVYSTDCESASWRRFGTGAYGLSSAQMQWISQNYLSTPEQCTDWRVAPLLASMRGLAPAHLVIGSLDPLQDDNHELAKKFKQANVAHELAIYAGLPHGFIRYGPMIGTVRRAVAECAAALARALA